MATSFLPTTIGVDEGLRSFTASAIVMFDFEAYMSSLDGAVTRMAGVSEEVFDEFGSAFGSEEAVMGGGHMGNHDIWVSILRHSEAD